MEKFDEKSFLRPFFTTIWDDTKKWKVLIQAGCQFTSFINSIYVTLFLGPVL